MSTFSIGKSVQHYLFFFFITSLNSFLFEFGIKVTNEIWFSKRTRNSKTGSLNKKTCCKQHEKKRKKKQLLSIERLYIFSLSVKESERNGINCIYLHDVCSAFGKMGSLCFTRVPESYYFDFLAGDDGELV